MFSNLNTQLADFPRAAQIAQGYQQFRISNIKMRFKSPFDTYLSGGASQKPYFYYMLDKTGSIPDTITVEGLKNMGAKPRAFDEKAITISWTPTVLTNVGVNNALTPPLGNQNKPIVSPWLSTSQNPQSPTWTANNVDHLGIYYIAVGTGLQGSYDVDVEVQFQFRKPCLATLTGATHATQVEYAQINTSVDGIVGGPDGV